MKKNVASQVVGAQLITAADGTAFTGAVTVYVTGDGGTQALGGTASGVCAHEGNGFHTYVPTQAETNYDHIAFTFIGTGAIPATVQTYPTFPQTGDSFARVGAPTGASIAADIVAVKSDTANILVDTNELQTDDVPGLIAALPAATDIVSAGPITTSAGAVSNVTTVATLTGHTAQTGDSFARVGAPTGASIAADIVALQATATDTSTNTQPIQSGTATAGNSVSITLAATASTVVDIYKNNLISIISGTGAGQTRAITSYSAGRVATILPVWATTPDATSVYRVQPAGWVTGFVTDAITAAAVGADAANKIGTATVNTNLSNAATLGNNIVNISGYTKPVLASSTTSAGTTTTAICSSASTTTGFYIGMWIRFTGGPSTNNTGLYRKITGYNGTTKTFSWATALPEAVASFNSFNVAPAYDIAAADIRTALGLAAANLDTQLSTIDSVVDLILADTGTDGVVISSATADQIATALLKLDWSGVTGEAARSTLNALRLLRNKYSVSTGVLTVTKEDDTTSAWTGAVTASASADPITGMTPA